MRRALLLFLLLLVPAYVFAEEEEPPLLMHISRPPAPGTSSTVISREEIERSHYPFVLDLLRSSPGLQVLQAGSPGNTAAGLARGSQFAQVLVLIDGVPINATLLPVNLAHLATTNVERIEITRGPQSALFGSSAEAAVVNIVTRHSGPFVSGLGEYGSDNTGRGQLRSGAGSDANHYSIAFERYDTDSEQEAEDPYRNDTFSARAKVMVTQWTSLAVQYHDVRADFGTSPGQEFRYHLLAVPVHQQITPWLNVEFRYSNYRQEIEPEDSQTSIYRVAARVRRDEKHEILAGYEYEQSETTAAGFLDREIQNDAVFAEYRLNIPKLSAALAIRSDNDNINDSRVSPFVSAEYRIADHVSLHGSAGTGFCRPAPEELVPSVTEQEKTTGISLGIGYNGSYSSQLAATLFRNRYSDFAVTEEYNATGVELNGSVQPAEVITLRANYTYTDAEDFQLASAHSGFLGLAVTQHKFQADLYWYINGDNGTGGDLNRADITASYDFPRGFQVYTRITNLFDSNYSEVGGFPAPNRAIFIGIRYQ